MASLTARPKLHVEGSDDLNSIANLVERHGIDRRVNESAPEINPIGSVEELLAGIKPAVELSGGRVIGFVLDADASLAERWASVRDRLRDASVNDVPEKAPEDGFIGESSRYRSRVGVWIMPDNTKEGTLEQFLETLIPDRDDVIFSHAKGCTSKAKELGARFHQKDQWKAIIHTWLAWQEVPGRPYGTAIKAKYFQHDSPTARKFVTWYAKLYGLPVNFPPEAHPPRPDNVME
jgi:hypothetical protein